MKPIIGIPKKGDDESFYEMMKSLTESTIYFDEIVIATADDIKLGDFELIKDKIKIIQKDFKTPLEAYNALFDYAKKNKKDLFLTQTDVLFPRLYARDWLQKMSELAQEEKVGAVTSLNGYGVSGPDYVDGLQWLGGWCVYYPFEVIKKVGGFDDKFPNGYGVDIDHSYRIHRANLKIIIMNYWVDHHMMNKREHDNDPNAEQMKKESSKYFKEKWQL